MGCWSSKNVLTDGREATNILHGIVHQEVDRNIKEQNEEPQNTL